jgi:hypothetical protein
MAEGKKYKPFSPDEIGLNQTVDFIFFTKNKQVWLKKNINVSEDEWTLPGTFGVAGLPEEEKNEKKNILLKCQNYALTIDDAKKRIMYKAKEFGFKGTEDDLNGIKDKRFYNVKYDRRTFDGENFDAKYILITQVFTVPVENTELFEGKGEWIELDNENIFRGHKIILNDLKDELVFGKNVEVYDSPPAFEEEEGEFDTPEFSRGGSRKRRGKKLNKTKKGRKQGGRKHSGTKQGGGKTRKNRHSKRKHSRRRHSRRRHH